MTFTLNSVIYAVAANLVSNTIVVFKWTGTGLTAITSALLTGTNPLYTVFYTIGSQSYLSVGNLGGNVTNFTIGSTTISASGTFNGGLVTAPVSSNTATAAFITSMTAGTSYQNTTAYDVMCNISCSIAAATSATITLGVGPATAPTANTVIPSFTLGAATVYNFKAVVPKGYYIVFNTTGTITISSTTVQSCPL
jgi:hypothetical protein